MDKMLSVEIMTKVETPKARQGSSTLPRSGMFWARSFNFVRLPVKNRSTHTAPTAWLSTVAVAAPRTPISSTKIKMGSRIMLHTAPITVVSILNAAKPCVVTKGFMPSTTSTNTLPKM